MISASNMVIVTGNMTADPEFPKDNIMKFRLAVNGAGRDAEGEYGAGFFDVTVFENGVADSHWTFIKNQVASGNYSKSTRVSVAGSLRHERWKAQDGTNRERISIVAHSVDYAGARQVDGADDAKGVSNATAGETAPTGLPTTF